MNTAPPSLAFEIDDPANAQLLIHNPQEINAHLRRLLDQPADLTLYLDAGQEIISATILSIAPESGELCVDLPAMADTVRIAAASTITISAAPERVKLQFRSHRHRLEKFEGRNVLYLSRPESILRLQRREFFRLDTPSLTPVTCKIPVQRNNGGDDFLQLTLIDISGGGLSLMAAPEQGIYFDSGKFCPHCRLEIPGEGGMLVGLEIKEIREIGKSGNRVYLKIGCEFKDLAPARLAQIQRYIARTERERKARQSGLG